MQPWKWGGPSPLGAVAFWKTKTNSLEQCLSWEANRSSSSQEMPRILKEPVFHYSIHNQPTPVPALSQNYPVYGSPHPYWRFTLILSCYLCLGLPNGLFPSGLPNKTLYVPQYYFTPEGEKQLEDRRLDGRIKETGCGLNLWGLEQAAISGFCKRSAEPANFIKCGDDSLSRNIDKKLPLLAA